MRRFWDQLTKSQKFTIMAGAVVAGALLLVQFVLLPYGEERQNVRSAIAAIEKVLREIGVLGAEYAVLRQRSEEIKRVIGRRPPEFALLTYLEKKAGDAALKGNIRSMNQLKGTPTESYEETGVEMKLDRLTMKQLTDFLYLAEAPEEMIRIRRISIAKMKESPEYLSALIQFFTYLPASPGGR